MSDYNWVLPRVAVGGMLQEHDVPQLLAEGVGYVVNFTTHEDKFITDAGIEQLWMNVGDDGTTKQDFFKNVLAPWFIERWFKDPHKKFNIHCDAGVNRGPSATMLCLMLLGLSASAAVRAIMTARPITQAGIAYHEDACKVAEGLGYLVR